MMTKTYQPELGQMMFGQPWKKYEAPHILVAALEYLGYEIERIMENNAPENSPRGCYNPMSNTGYVFKVGKLPFDVEAYSWNDEVEQPWNFKWRDLEVSWYKRLGRGTTVNREVDPREVSEMLTECLEALRQYERELEENT